VGLSGTFIADALCGNKLYAVNCGSRQKLVALTAHARIHRTMNPKPAHYLDYKHFYCFIILLKQAAT